MKTKPHSWASIAARYQDLVAHGWGPEMLGLVQHIISSGASNHLFAYTSLDNLKLSNYEPLEDTEILHVKFDRQKQVFCFEYYATECNVNWSMEKRYNQEQPEFHRYYPAEKGNEKFDQFLRWVGW